MIGESFGQYRILSLLGEGGMGRVYRVQDAAGRELALKLILDEALEVDEPQASELRARFKREAKLTSALDHPNIVKTFDYGEIDATLFLACELVEGGNLGELLRRRGRLTEHQGLRLISELLGALQAIEAAGLIHRDIKPGNVLMSSAGAAKLSDLGLARSTEAQRTLLTRTGHIIGTPDYMAPEQISADRELDIRCDIYATGAMLFHCLCGRPPFKGKSMLAVLRKHLNETPPDIRTLIPELSPRVASLVSDLLAKNPKQRPHSPGEVLDRVEELLAELGTLPVGAETIIVAPRPSTVSGLPTPTPTEAPTDLLATRPPTLTGGGTVELPVIARRETITLEAIDHGAGLARAHLRWLAPEGPRALFVYAQGRLQVGRNAVGREGQDLCLRHRPARGHESLIRRISGRHFGLFVRAGRAGIVDFGSRFGTTVNGQRIAANDPQLLEQHSEVLIADTLALRLHALTPGDPHNVILKDRGDCADDAPAIYIERAHNGVEHSYALIPGRLGLNLGPDGSLAPADQAPIELLNIAGLLWLRGGPVPAGCCATLAIGSTFTLGDTRFEVRELRPEDQKS